MNPFAHTGDFLSNDQMGFPFLPELPTHAVPGRAPRKKSAKAQTSMGSPALDASEMARTLESHPDYRVLRRLQPRLLWPSSVQGDLRTVLVLDTETTGLDSARESIIELALLRVNIDIATGQPVGKVEVYDELEDPGKPIPAEVTHITGLKDADVRGHRLDEARINALLEGVDLVIAHNAAFDRPFVERRLPQFSQLPWACSFADIDWKAQGRSSAKLESLAQALGWFYDAHRAEMDCHALLAVLAAPSPQVAQEGGALPPNGLSRLWAAAQMPSYRLSATLAPFDAKDTLKARGYRWNAEHKVWQTRVSDDAALQLEGEWLKEHVYGQKVAHVQVETLEAINKYSNRSGKIAHARL